VSGTVIGAVSGGMALDLVTDYGSSSANIIATLTNPTTGFGLANYVSGQVGSVGNIPLSAYDDLVTNNYVSSVLTGELSADFDFVVVNENKAKLTGLKDLEEVEGLYVAFVDYFDALVAQRIISTNDTDPMNVVAGLNVYKDNVAQTLSATSDFVKPLTGAFTQSSVSEDYMKQFLPISLLEGGTAVDKAYSHYIGVIISRTVADPNFEGRINTVLTEAFVGSIFSSAKNPSTGQSSYIVDIVNQQSNYVKMFGPQPGSAIGGLNIEDFQDQTNDTAITYVGNKVNADLMGFRSTESQALIDGDSVASNLRLALDKVCNLDLYPLDFVVDAGLSTIAEFTANTINDTGELYDPDNDDEDCDQVGPAGTAIWRDVCEEWIYFCEKVRKDCMVLLDVPRSVEITGRSKKIRKTSPTKTFSSEIAPSLRYLTGLNSSYAALYANWLRTNDPFSGKLIWTPPSVKIVGVYIPIDLSNRFWEAPAGLNRGILTNVADLAYDAKPRDEDQLYLKSINYSKNFPGDGITVWGNKTTLIKQSAFDRVNVRRLFLGLEKFTRNTMKYFIQEPNNFATRRRVLATLEPKFTEVQALGGIQEFRIVVDETNNTPTVVDSNEMRIAIVVKPTRTAEFILVDFIAIRSDADISFVEIT
jgi:hypothetical protein